MFDYISYFQRLTKINRLAKTHRFESCTCSGVDYLEGVLERFRTSSHLVCISDVCEESTFQQGGGWFRRRLITVFLLARFNPAKSGDRETQMALCRELYRQFVSYMLHERSGLSDKLLYLDLSDIRSRELGGSFLNNCTGLYFMLAVDEPTDLIFRDTEWAEEPPLN